MTTELLLFCAMVWVIVVVLYLVKYSGFFQETEDLVRGDIPKQDLEVLYGIVFPPYII